MSNKRSRSTFEADLDAPYAVFGTPLPNEDDARDDGAYLPVWKQDVRDEKGRRRLHGAFTGGWSAGYFNTVGSKEGWTPSTFVSSRTNRRKDDAAAAETIQKRAEEYMDDEDLADAAEAQTLQTSGAFAGLGSSAASGGAGREEGGIVGLLRPSGDTKGLQLLRRMGWKDGQGIGPKVRRSARIDMGGGGGGNGAASTRASEDETHLFAPDDVETIRFVRKTDRKGIGHRGATRLKSMGKGDDSGHEDDDTDGDGGPNGSHSAGAFLLGAAAATKAKKKAGRGAFGVGVLNDTGSDEEDAYEMGPRISYNRVIGGGKTKKKKRAAVAAAVANPAVRKAPVFVPKTVRAGNTIRRCHDGRLPLDGFVLATMTTVEDTAALLAQYAPPPVPDGWKTRKNPTPRGGASTDYTSTADAARASILEPRSRAMLLGEKALPGKSVFDFISATGRDRLAAASGNRNLPPGLGQVPDEAPPLSDDEKRRALWEAVPKLDQATAAAALSRSASSGPYADNEAKRSRYRRYLMSQATVVTAAAGSSTGQQQQQQQQHAPLPDKEPGTSDDEYVREMTEFYNCARIFKPMTGFMASRFTTSKTAAAAARDGPGGGGGGDAAAAAGPRDSPEPVVKDAAEEAARMGMYGHLTRSVDDFYPTRLLCKRFNVQPPMHARADQQQQQQQHPRDMGASPAPAPAAPAATAAAPSMPPAATAETPSATTGTTASSLARVVAPAAPTQQPQQQQPQQQFVQVHPETNDAVEAESAHADVLRAIFGDSDSDSEGE